MKASNLIVGGIIVSVLIGLVYSLFFAEKTVKASNIIEGISPGDKFDPHKCIPSKGEFPSFDNSTRNWDWNLLEGIARSVDPQFYNENRSGAIESVAGFFKLIDVEPSVESFRAYREEIISYVQNDGSSAYQVITGALKC